MDELTTTCMGCGQRLELMADASYARCPRCGSVSVVDTVPPWALFDAAAEPVPPPAASASAPVPSSLLPPPPRRTSPPEPRHPPPSVLRGFGVAPSRRVGGTQPPPTAGNDGESLCSRDLGLAEELIEIRCEGCGQSFHGPIGMLHCPRCGAHNAIDSAPPWQVTRLDPLA